MRSTRPAHATSRSTSRTWRAATRCRCASKRPAARSGPTTARTLYYLTKDEAKRDFRLWRHTIGQQGADKLLYEEKAELFELGLDKTRDDFYVVVTSNSKDTTEQQVIAADEPLSAPRVVLPRKKELEYFLDHRIGQFYLRANDTGRNFRLVQTSATKPSLETARELPLRHGPPHAGAEETPAGAGRL